MNQLDADAIDAKVIVFLRVLKRLNLISKKTYATIGAYLIDHGKSKKDAWRKANWKDFLKIG